MNNRQLIKKMKERGWECEVTKGNHIRLTHTESGEFIICASTASDHRATKNLLARAKRVEEGRVLPRPHQQEELT